MLLLGACATAGGKPQASLERNVLGNAPFGAYLAGRVAGQLNEMTLSAQFYRDALANDPDNQTLLERSFSASLAEGQFDQALPLAAKLASDDTALSLAPLLLVLDDVNKGQYAKALEIAQGMPSTGFNSLVGPLTQAWILAGLERYDDALESLKQLESSASFASFENFHRALILSRAGRSKEAEAAFKKTLTLPGGASPRTLLAYGRFLASVDRGKEAVSLYDDYLKALPDSAQIMAARDDILKNRAKPVVASPAAGLADMFVDTALALNRNGTRGAAIIYAQLARFLVPSSDETLMLLASLYDGSGQDETAARLYGEVPADSPLHWEAQRNYATVEYRLGHIDVAAKLLEVMYAENKNDLSVAVTLADIYRAQKAPEKALEIYNSIIGGIAEPQENQWSLFYTRATTYQQMGKWPEAEADFVEALKLSPEEPVVLNYLGYSWVDRGEHLDEALALIKKAVDLRPNDGNIVDSLGWAYYKLGRYQDAVEQLEKAVLLRPDSSEINAHLGDAYWRVGRTLEARFQWSHAIAMGAEGQDALILEAKRETKSDGNPFIHDRK